MNLGALQPYAFQPQSTDGLQQGKGHGGKQQPELVGPPAVGRGAVSEEHLLLLDAVYHLTGASAALVSPPLSPSAIS